MKVQSIYLACSNSHSERLFERNSTENLDRAHVDALKFKQPEHFSSLQAAVFPVLRTTWGDTIKTFISPNLLGEVIHYPAKDGGATAAKAMVGLLAALVDITTLALRILMIVPAAVYYNLESSKTETRSTVERLKETNAEITDTVSVQSRYTLQLGSDETFRDYPTGSTFVLSKTQSNFSLGRENLFFDSGRFFQYAIFSGETLLFRSEEFQEFPNSITFSDWVNQIVVKHGKETSSYESSSAEE